MANRGLHCKVLEPSAVSPKLLVRANVSDRGSLTSKKRPLTEAQIADTHSVSATVKYHEHHLG